MGFVLATQPEGPQLNSPHLRKKLLWHQKAFGPLLLGNNADAGLCCRWDIYNAFARIEPHVCPLGTVKPIILLWPFQHFFLWTPYGGLFAHAFRLHAAFYQSLSQTAIVAQLCAYSRELYEREHGNAWQIVLNPTCGDTQQPHSETKWKERCDPPFSRSRQGRRTLSTMSRKAVSPQVGFETICHALTFIKLTIFDIR